jgi:hypothetical protein
MSAPSQTPAGPSTARRVRERAGPALDWVGELLWPGAELHDTPLREPAHAGRTHRFAAMSWGRHPCVLVPVETRRAAAAVIRRYGFGTSARARTAKQVVAASAHLGVPQLLAPRMTVELDEGGSSLWDHLARLLDEPGLLFSVTLRRHAQPSSKPVLHLVSRSGQTIGFAKVGWNTITRGQLRSEAAFLEGLPADRLRLVQVPRILHAGMWGSLDLLVVSPLDSRRSSRGDPIDPAILGEVARLHGVSHQPLLDSPFWTRVQEHAANLDPVRGIRVGEVMEAMGRAAGVVPLRFGTAHGDWRPKNMARRRGGRLQVWDWEQWSDRAPVGFDAVHHHLESAIWSEGLSLDGAARACRERSGSVISWLQGADVDLDLFIDLYVLDQCVMHLAKAARLAEEAGAPLSDPLADRCDEMLRWLAHRWDTT